MSADWPTIRLPPAPTDAELQADRDTKHAAAVAEWFARQANVPTNRCPNWVDPTSGDHAYARTGSTRLGQSAPTVCLCGHSPDDHFGHTGYCLACQTCPLFELDRDR